MRRELARVPTAHAARYMQQLCKHWSHKLDVTLVATMTAEADVLVVLVEAADEATLERMKGVVSKHLDRFAFREAPLPFEWVMD